MTRMTVVVCYRMSNVFLSPEAAAACLELQCMLLLYLRPSRSVAPMVGSSFASSVLGTVDN